MEEYYLTPKQATEIKDHYENLVIGKPIGKAEDEKEWIINAVEYVSPDIEKFNVVVKSNNPKGEDYMGFKKVAIVKYLVPYLNEMEIEFNSDKFGIEF